MTIVGLFLFVIGLIFYTLTLLRVSLGYWGDYGNNQQFLMSCWALLISFALIPIGATYWGISSRKSAYNFAECKKVGMIFTIIGIVVLCPLGVFIIGFDLFVIWWLFPPLTSVCCGSIFWLIGSRNLKQPSLKQKTK